MSATDFDPYTRPRVGHLQADLAAAGYDRHARGAGADGEGFSFGDFVDILNPLQHLPVVGTVYRELTGDRIGGTARIVGGGLYGGVFGMVGAAFNQIFEDATGRDMAETALAVASGEALGGEAAGTQPVDTAAAGETIVWNAASAEQARAFLAAQAAPADAASLAPETPAAAAQGQAAARSAGATSPAAADGGAGGNAAPPAPLAEGALTGDAALAAFAADLRRTAGPMGAPTGTPTGTPAAAPQQAEARPARASGLPAGLAGGRPESFMPVSPRDFAGPRPQTGPARALATETVLPPEPRRPQPAQEGPVSPIAPTPRQAPAPAPVSAPAPAPGSAAMPHPMAAPASDADFAARMMHALKKYEAMQGS